MEIIQNFMQVYMYELEKYLQTKEEAIKQISFQSDEANTDRQLKEFLKKTIEDSFSSIPQSSELTSVEFEGKAGTDMDILKTIRINRVLLPEEITNHIFKIIQTSKDSVSTKPDLCFEILYNHQFYYETIELKSTKQDAIPGSSIQQILPEQWVIFIKHSDNDIKIATGQYIHAINSKMAFPDRSPRPQVSFKEMTTWNHSNRILKYASLIYKKDNNEHTKYNLIQDWQKVLSERWIDMLFHNTTSKKNEPWFHNTMRKFILSFLEQYESLSDPEKAAFKTNIQHLIKDE